MSSFTSSSPVLVIDDDACMRRTLDRVLKREGWFTSLYEDGPSAIKAVEGGQKFCAVVCDWHMPGCEGDEVYRRLVSHLNGRPFVLFSSDFELFLRLHPEIAGEISVLDKKPNNLISKLSSLLTS